MEQTKEKSPSKRAGKMKKLRNDVNFIDPKTGEKLCSFNECVEKFDRIEEEIVTRERRHETIQLVVQFHVCRQCGRKHRNGGDKFKSWGNFLDVMAGSEPQLSIKDKGEKHEQS